MKKYNKNDPLVRQAIWECHNRRCYYFGHVDGELKFSDLVIDHVIPEATVPKRLKILVKEYNLDEDFELDSLYNYVPCKQRPNNLKGKDFSPGLAIALGSAAKMAARAERKIEQLKRAIDYRKNTSLVKYQIDGDHQKAEDLYDFVTDETEGFGEQRYICDDGQSTVYCKSINSILLVGYLPRCSMTKGSCLIVFRTLRLRSCSITLGHEEILESLCLGHRTSISSGLRRFIVCPDNHKHDLYYIQLGNNRFPLLLEEVTQLFELVDDFVDEYLKALQNLETLLGTKKFQLSKRENSFRLIRIKRGLWRYILQFANEFDAERGSSSWHMFDANLGMLKVYTASENEVLDKGYHAILYPEAVDEYWYDSFRYPNDEMWIVWKPLHNSLGRHNIADFGKRRIWNAIIAYNWLISELIPYVIYYYLLEEKPLLDIIRRFLSSLNISRDHFYRSFLKKFNIQDYVINYYDQHMHIDADQVLSIEDLTQLISNLQTFYCIHKKTSISEKEVSLLYSAFHLCLKHTSINDWQYITEKLNYLGDSKEEILRNIENYSPDIGDGCVSSYLIDYAFRCFIYALDFKSNLNLDEIKQIAKSLEPFTKAYQSEQLIEKYLNVNGS